MFVAIGRLGRSLGMHLLLASQRLDEGRLRGSGSPPVVSDVPEDAVRQRIPNRSGNLDAYQLPSTPGAGFLRISGGEPIRFQTALVSGPLPSGSPAGVTDATASARCRRSAPGPRGASQPRRHGDSGRPTRTVLGAVLDRLSGQGPPAHQVWLPPLGPAPALDTLLADVGCTTGGLTVPIGIVDRPFEQCRTPLMVDYVRSRGKCRGRRRTPIGKVDGAAHADYGAWRPRMIRPGAVLLPGFRRRGAVGGTHPAACGRGRRPGGAASGRPDSRRMRVGRSSP